MATRTVLVTGMGALTPLGTSVASYWESALAGRSGIRTIPRLALAELPVAFGGVVEGFDPETVLDPKTAKNTDRFAQLAVAAADEAVTSAGLSFGEGGVSRDRVGVVIGSGIGGCDEMLEQVTRLVQKGYRRVSPFFIPKMIGNGAAGMVAIRWGLRGPNLGTVSACSSASHALGIGLMLIRAGMADVVIAGGSEAALNLVGMAGFISMRALSTRSDAPEKASRPFDAGRDGFVMGEGACAFVLEAKEHADARGAEGLCELAGFGATDDGHHMTAPEPGGEGASAAMDMALKDAGVRPDEVSYISAHGTSTPLGDHAETLAIKRSFGEHAKKLWVGATKSQVGHLLGAAGGVSSVAAILAIAKGAVPPTINLDEPDPKCDLDYIPGAAREIAADVTLANAFGFGGHNATLVFRRCS